MKLAYAQTVGNSISQIQLAAPANQQQMLSHVCSALDFISMELIAITVMRPHKINVWIVPITYLWMVSAPLVDY